MAVKARLSKTEETRLDAFEMKGLRKILRVAWTAKTNEWVHNKAGVERELLDKTLAYEASILWPHHEETRECQVPGARKRGRPHTTWMDNIKTWTGLPVEESIRLREDRDKWRKYVHDVANLRIDDG